MIKIAFNKQIIDRCDSKIDFRADTLIDKILSNLYYHNNAIPRLCNGSTADSGSVCGGSSPPWGKFIGKMQ